MDASSFAHHIPRALRFRHFPALPSAFQLRLRGRLFRGTSALLLLLFAGSALLFCASGQAHAARPADANAIELNELLSNPATDWNGDGQKGVSDQWIELANIGGSDVDLTGFELLSQGSNNNQPTTVPSVQISANSRLVIFIKQVPKIRLFPGGGELELLDTSGQTISSVNYPTLGATNLTAGIAADNGRSPPRPPPAAPIASLAAAQPLARRPSALWRWRWQRRR